MGEIKPTNAYLGMNLDTIITQVKPGQVTYALNAAIQSADGNQITYQNEQANEHCYDIPAGYTVIGRLPIIEKDIVVLWLVNTSTADSEIGVVKGCTYTTKVNSKCLNFSIDDPVLKAVPKVTSCTTEVYWASGRNPRRYIDLDNIPYKQQFLSTPDNPCDVITTTELDCNKLNVQPNFSIPLISYETIESEGETTAGSYQFAFQYCNVLGEGYTSYYSVTNTIPIYDYFKITPDFNYQVSKSIVLDINNIDNTGIFDYYNLAVIKTINGIVSVDLVGTFQIQSTSHRVVYTGQSKAGITLSTDDIFEKFPVYDTAADVTTLQDILVWADLTTTERINYQSIASQITPQWVSWKMPPDKKQFADPVNAANLRGYMRDEPYPLDIVFLLDNGHQTDRFPLVGRAATASDLKIVDNDDSDFQKDTCSKKEPKPRWQVYNTATLLGTDSAYNPDDDCYQGPYQYGEFSYWESTETYPCNSQVWGSLQGQPIRHFKFPDNLVSPHHDDKGNIYTLGIRIDVKQVYDLIKNSTLTQEQKEAIQGFKIVRGDRSNNKSVKAKGLFFNVGKYDKKNSTFFYPNYPFNDLRADPFININPADSTGEQIFISLDEVQNFEASETTLYSSDLPGLTWKNNGDIITAIYEGQFAGQGSRKTLRLYFDGGQIFSTGSLKVDNTNNFIVTVQLKRTTSNRIDIVSKLNIIGSNPQTVITTGSLNGIDFSQTHTLRFTGEASSFGFDPLSAPQSGDILATSAQINYKAAPIAGEDPNVLHGFNDPDSQMRMTFHSPDTSFYQPSLGNVIKLDTVEYGSTRSHFVEVKEHSKYGFPSLSSYIVALGVGLAIGFASGTYGVSDNPFSGSAAFTAFGVMEDIIFKLIPKKNMAYQFNSVGNYTHSVPVANDLGSKIRMADIASYITSGIMGVGDTHLVNNYQRESSVYIRTTSTLPFPDSLAGVPTDTSRFTLSQVGCDNQYYSRAISAYYGSIKNINPDQYGQIYSYKSIDTGTQVALSIQENFTGNRYQDVFGGDVFINKFAFKRKLPFFVDNRVKFPPEADVFYDELGNIGYPKYWFSTDIKRGSGGSFNLGSLFGVKVNNFDCKEGAFFYDSGKIYLFAYGIVDFFVESTINVDLRQAYNNAEGDYYPRVSTDIPDDWLQEVLVPIAQDNTYTYNKSYSKQNEENVFTTLPVDFIPGQLCKEKLPNRAIYSEDQKDVIDYKRNNWLIYRPVSYFDFPLNYGKLTSIDGLETRQLLARFENKSLLYNALLTASSSVADVYLGQQIFSKNTPPIDFAETDTGYAGSQHKFLLKTEYGHVSVDAKRGDVFLFDGRQPKNLGGEELKLFLTANLDFKIKQAFPNYDIDNNFKGVGLHGVYDTYYDRIVITKLDYKPLNSGIVYNPVNGTFTLDGAQVNLEDSTYFRNVSFTLSYSFKTQSWISFHSYLPRVYIPWINKFYSSSSGSIWSHNTVLNQFNNFYGQIAPYIIEYPMAYKFQDEILQSVKDYTKVNQITNSQAFVQTNDIFFNKVMIYNDQQHSGIRNLIAKPKNNMAAYLQYPKVNSDSVDILFAKSNNFYNYNGIWDVVKDQSQPIWGPPGESLSFDKDLNTANMQYTGRSFKKYPLMAKDSRIRHILDNRDDVRLTSQFLVEETAISYK